MPTVVSLLVLMMTKHVREVFQATMSTHGDTTRDEQD
jgi:hypothetical protein